MAIRIIEGVPGSGKTYYAVKHLASKYFEKQEDGRYELIKPVTIVTNIDSFHPEHISLQNEIAAVGGVQSFFSESYQRDFTSRFDSPIVYIIDEAQKYFRKGARDLNEVYSYFEYHRHFGHDIYLVTQNSKKLPPDIALLTEYIIEASPRTRSVIGEFKYKWLSDGELLNREGFRPEQGIFNLYKSMDKNETEKIKNPVIKTVGLALVGIVILGVGATWFLYRSFHPVASTPVPGSVQPASSASATSSVGNPAGLAGLSTVRVKISCITTFFGSTEKTFLVFQDAYFPIEKFPYKLEVALGSYWANVPKELIDKKSEDADSRRNASDSSGAAHARRKDESS